MKSKGFQPKRIVSLLIAGIIGFSVSLMVAAVGSYLIATETLGEASERGTVVLALLLGGLAAAFIAVKRGQGNRLTMCLAGAGGYYLMLLCCGALVFDGIRSGVGITAIMTLGASLVVWVLGLKGNKKAKYRLPKL